MSEPDDLALQPYVSLVSLFSTPPPRVAFGNSHGLAVVDYIQKTVVLNLGTAELYGPSDPHQRQPRSPRKSRQPSGGEQQSQTPGSMRWCWLRNWLRNWSVKTTQLAHQSTRIRSSL